MNGQYIDVDGVKTFYIDEGVGPTIVLFHGAAFAVDARVTWFRTIEALKASYRVIAFDQIGFGRTEMPKDGIYKNRLERVPHAINFLKAMNIRDACLVGHSEGGFIATRISIVEPALVSRVVIVTSGATAPYLGGGRDVEWIKAAEATYNDRRQFDSEDQFIEISSRLSLARDATYEANLRENYRYAKDSGHFEIFLSLPTADTNYGEREKLQREYILPYLQKLNDPVLLVWPLNDPTVVVERGLRLLGLLPRGELHVFANAAHNVMHDRAEDFGRLLSNWCMPH